MCPQLDRGAGKEAGWWSVFYWGIKYMIGCVAKHDLSCELNKAGQPSVLFKRTQNTENMNPMQIINDLGAIIIFLQVPDRPHMDPRSGFNPRLASAASVCSRTPRVFLDSVPSPTPNCPPPPPPTNHLTAPIGPQPHLLGPVAVCWHSICQLSLSAASWRCCLCLKHLWAWPDSTQLPIREQLRLQVCVFFRRPQLCRSDLKAQNLHLVSPPMGRQEVELRSRSWRLHFSWMKDSTASDHHRD